MQEILNYQYKQETNKDSKLFFCSSLYMKHQ